MTGEFQYTRKAPGRLAPEAIGLALEGQPISESEFARLEECCPQKKRAASGGSMPVGSWKPIQTVRRGGKSRHGIHEWMAQAIEKAPAIRRPAANKIQVRHAAAAEIALWTHTVATG
jgi:hypothetical protein